MDRSEIGAASEAITPLLAKGLQLPVTSGVVIVDVRPGGPAESAGLKVNDIVLAVDGKQIRSLPQLASSSYLHPTDELMTLEVLRGTEKITLHVPVLSQKHNVDRLLDLVDPQKNLVPKIGVLAIDVDRSRIQRRVDTRYCDTLTTDLDEALALCEAAKREGRPLSVGLVGNCADVLPELARRCVEVDVVTDQTSAHDPLNGYVPQGLTPSQAGELRERDPQEYVRRSTASMVVHVDAMLAMQRAGAVAFDYGNNIRRFACDAGCADAFLIPGFVPEYIRPLFCTGQGPFRWVALSGDPRDIARTDELALELFPDNEILTRWLRLARGRFAFQGLPARICWLGYGDRARMGDAMNELVRKGEISAPVAIGRDHLDTGSVASPYRETEKMLDGSDAIADWPLLNFALNTASGASWVSFHHGGGVGMGYSLHAGQVTVADGTANAAQRIRRVLNNDPGIGVARHADAGYELARETAREKGIHIPMAGE